MRKKLFLLFFLVAPFATFAQNANVKLGYIDIQALFISMPETVAADSTIKKAAAIREAEVKRLEDEYTRKLQDYKENEQKWDDVIKQNRMEELQTLQLKNFYQQAQSDLQKQQEKLQVPILEKLRKTINEVGAENGFLYIFDLNTLQFKSNDAIDVTPFVQKKLGIKELKTITPQMLGK